MSNNAPRQIAEILPIAERLQTELAPFCHRIELGGSLRRRRPLVRDIELVAIARIEMSPPIIGLADSDLFPSPSIENLLWWKLNRMNVDYKKKGEKYRQFFYQEICVDLFTAIPGNWGWIYAIRTGSADFSHHLAKALNKAGYTSREGWITRIDDPLQEPIQTMTEQDVFDLAGIPYREPNQRE